MMKKFAPLFLCVISLVGLVMVSYGFLRMKFSPSQTVPAMSVDAQHNKEFEDANQRLLTDAQMLNRLSNLSLFSLSNLTAPLAGNLADGTEVKNAQGKSQAGMFASKSLNASNASNASYVPNATKLTKASSISMIYVSNNMARVVMYGNTYSVGDRLPSGANLVEINLDSIVTEKKGRRQTIKTPQSAVVGSTQKLKAKEDIQ
jgi:hypothetical protein